MSTWEERMAWRASLRAEALRLANQREDAWLPEGHLHGTLTACPCGAETGITCVAFDEGWVQPDPCETCGKPVSAFCDGKPWRDGAGKHVIGCPEHPDTQRCTRCGGTFLNGALITDAGWVHMGGCPAAGG